MNTEMHNRRKNTHSNETTERAAGAQMEEVPFMCHCHWKCMQCKTFYHLADAGHAGHHQFVVAVALHSGLTKEQVNFVVISAFTFLALWHLSHGNKGGLWHKKKRNL